MIFQIANTDGLPFVLWNLLKLRWCKFLTLEIDIVHRRLLQCHYRLMVKIRGEVGMIGSMQI